MSPCARHSRGHGAGGWSLLETMVAVGIVATGLLVLVEQMSISFRETSLSEDRAFAYQKAAALLGEVGNAIAMGRVTNSVELLALHDADYEVVLTTRKDGEGLPFAPDHLMSGNVMRQGHWVWARRLTIEPAETNGLFRCRAVLAHWSDRRQWEVEASHAQLFSLLPEADAPEQAFDVYVLACAGAPSLWGDLAQLRMHVENAAAMLRQQSQASVRLHWITRLGYGRDPCYAPFVNTATGADAPQPYAYWLPGALGGSQTGAMLYHHELLDALHRTEAGLLGGFGPGNPWPVTLADQHNHCLRTPAAWALFEQRVAAGLEDATAPPWQLLLEDMHRRPERYRNAVLLNLHGAALPMPPLRNYSDPARDPVGRPGVRVVTHPARLWTPRDPDGDGNDDDTLPVELRVHAFRSSGSGDVLAEPILVQIFGADLTGSVNGATNPTLQVHRLQGGIDPATGRSIGPDRDYVGFDEPGGEAPRSPGAPYAMWFQAGYVAGNEPYTWLKLYNTPLCAGRVGNRGLHQDGRLYGLDYVPSPVDPAFAHDLAFESEARVMRNTARWRIRIPARALALGLPPAAAAPLRVVTRIGDDATTGRRWPTPVQPLNVSETWTWWTASPDAVPVTERAQFLGDPRLCPYADLLAGGAFAHGYNWHFDDLVAGADARPLWPGFDAARLQDGFGSGCRADAPRFLALLREALQDCGAVLVTPRDAPAAALVFGGEIARAGAGGAAAPVTVSDDWTGEDATSVDTITPSATTGTRLLRRSTWWAEPWLGELFPDDQGTVWIEDGNLAAGGGDCQWWLRSSTPPAWLPYGTSFAGPAGAMLGDAGAVMLVDHGTLAATFVTSAAADAVQPTAATNAINVATNLVPPTMLPATRTFTTTGAFADALPAFAFTDTYPRSVASVLETLWTGAPGVAGGVVDFARDPAQRAFLVPWTVDAGDSGDAGLAAQALLAGIRALHAGGEPTLPGRIAQVPRLQIVAPAAGSAFADPDGVTLRWQTTWQRFDGQPYTGAYPPGFAESEHDLVYRVLWSGDRGATWSSAVTGAPAQPGVWPDAGDRLADAGGGSESFTPSLPADLPDGDYTFLVEAWRSGGRCHSSSHQVRLYLRRGP